jgi:hypothetical protein
MRRLCLTIAGCAALAGPAAAERLENQTAVFSALDKVTARISVLEIPLNQTIRFGSLKVTPRVCYSRPPTEPPKTTTFVEVDEVQLDGSEKRVFSGWMFAESPGLNAVEHPVFDVWLTSCAGAQSVAQRGQQRPGAAPDPNAQPADALERRRVRR